MTKNMGSISDRAYCFVLMFYCVLLIWGIVPCNGMDYLTTAPFEFMFPFIESQATINTITIALNKANGTKNSIKILNKWIDVNWKNPPASTAPPKTTVTTTQDPYNFGRLADKEYARNLAVTFLEHRLAVKYYIRVLSKTTETLQYFNATEAEKVTELFWEADFGCYNLFMCTEGQFYDKLRAEFFNSHKNLIPELMLISMPLYQFPVVGERLGWKYER